MMYNVHYDDRNTTETFVLFETDLLGPLSACIIIGPNGVRALPLAAGKTKVATLPTPGEAVILEVEALGVPDNLTVALAHYCQPA